MPLPSSQTRHRRRSAQTPHSACGFARPCQDGHWRRCGRPLGSPIGALRRPLAASAVPDEVQPPRPMAEADRAEVARSRC